MPSEPRPIPAPPERERTKLWSKTFVTILFVNFCVFLGFNMMLPTLSLFLDREGLTEREIGLVFGSFTLSAITFRLLAPKLSATFGTLTVVRFGLITCGCGALCYILARHMGFYILARLMQGAGFAVSSTLLVSVAAGIIPPRRLGEGIGYVGLGATLSLAMGPILGLDMVKRFGFEPMFVVSSSTCFAAALVSLLVKGRNLPPAKAPAGEARSWLERSALPPSLLIFIYACGISAITAFLAIYCEERGLPSAANFFVASTVGTIVARLGSGRIYDRRGHLFVVPPAILMLVFSVLAILANPPAWMVYFAAVIYGLGAGTLFPAVQTLTLSSVPPERHTVGSAYFFVAFDLGMGLGTVFMGFVAGHYHDYGAAFVCSALFFALLMLVYLALYLRRPGSLGRRG
ncbi:MAG: MFS transporter [Deltaproteobacteria bacterium]|jgi:MFS family permease|nr:MFS transporter [Deltaproteobacteria bacterium]